MNYKYEHEILIDDSIVEEMFHDAAKIRRIVVEKQL
jgi:hypothetical protein